MSPSLMGREFVENSLTGFTMKLITRDTDYAIRALTYIARSKEKVTSVATLVEELKLPKPFLRKILQILHKEGILKASKGYGGGFSLACEPDKIYLGELIEIFQGRLKLNECIFRKRLCPDRNICPLKRKIDAIEKYVVSKLGAVSIRTLLE